MNDQTRNLLHNLQTHDLAENLRLRRAQWAREAGLPVEEFAMPFPGNTVNIVKQSPLAWIAAATLGLGTLGAALVALPRPGPLAAPPAPLPNQEFRIRWWIEEGQVKTTAEPITEPTR